MREMKDSGIEWIGQIPKDWKTMKLSYASETITDYTASGSFADLAANVTYLDDEDYAMLVRTADLSGKREMGNIYVNKHSYDYLKNSNLYGEEIILPNVGSVGEVYYYMPLYERATLAPNSIMIRAKEYSKFLYYLFSTKQYESALKGLANATTQAKFNKTQLRKMKVIQPPLPEQKKIADFLDAKCSEIDALTADIEKQIETLEAYKKSLITEAVTKGLNPDVEMKDSGIEWIGQIPYNWKIGRIKNIIEILTDFTANGSFADLAKNVEYLDYEDYARLVRLTDLREGLSNQGIYVSEESYNYLSKSKLFGGEILVANVGAYAGLFCEMPENKGRCTLGPNMFLLRTNKRMLSHFLYYLGQSKYIWEQLQQKATATAQPKLNKDNVKNVSLVIPTVYEQKIIVTWLDEKCKEIDMAVENKKEQLMVLADYKKSLIYEYVTGKKEVPNE